MSISYLKSILWWILDVRLILIQCLFSYLWIIHELNMSKEQKSIPVFFKNVTEFLNCCRVIQLKYMLYESIPKKNIMCSSTVTSYRFSTYSCLFCHGDLYMQYFRLIISGKKIKSKAHTLLYFGLLWVQRFPIDIGTYVNRDRR